jgi:hypothetical protein
MQRLRGLLGIGSGEAGQTLIVGAFVFIGLFVLGALTIDVGGAWLQRRNVQNDADAAALAGAQLLPDDEAGARAVAIDYVNQNISNLASAPVITFGDLLPDGRPLSIRVEVHKVARTDFASGVGIGDQDIGAHAKAMVRSAQLPGPGVFPVALDQTTWNFAKDPHNAGSLVVLKAVPDNNPTPGGFQLLDFGQGGHTVCDSVMAGSDNPVVDPQPSEQGDVSKLNGSDCLTNRMTAARHWGCFNLADVLDNTGKLKDRCNPLIGAKKGADVLYPDEQPTSVALVPIVSSFVGLHNAFDLLQGTDDERVFSFFFLDPMNIQQVLPARTATDTSGDTEMLSGPTCNNPNSNPHAQVVALAGVVNGPGGGGGGGPAPGQCEIVGQFLLRFDAVLAAGGAPVGDFDQDSVVKVVQLVE